MKTTLKYLYLSFTLFICSIFIFSSCNRNPKGWQYPDMTRVPPGALGDSIKYGKELISKTPLHIGPEMADTSKRYSGNNLACANCHIDAGTRPNALGFVGVYLLYPEYDARVDTSITIQQRVNECMQRSMNGRSLPLDSYEMRCITLYYKWISSEVLPQIVKQYEGLPKIQFMSRTADPTKGKKIYTDKCMSCHAENGAGGYNKGEPKNGFDIPAVWGSDTYNDGAGMYRLITSAEFIKAKMPFLDADLTDEEAWDVAAYINSMPHPQKQGLEKDFPDLNKKPADCPYPPYNDSIPQLQHKYGPYNFNDKK